MNIMSESYEDAKQRIPSQKEKIINLLRDAGEEGVLNTELVKHCIRFNARISELYAEGYKINVEHLGKGMYKYVLISEPKRRHEIPKSALEIVLNEIHEKYQGKIEAQDLQRILAFNNFHIVRKPGSYKFA